MKSTLISLGDKVEIINKHNTDSQDNLKTLYVSQVTNLIDDNNISIAMPIANGGNWLYESGEKLRMNFYTKKGIYSCKGKVMKRLKENQLPMLEVQLISEFEKIQRRQYYRFECLLNMNYRIETTEELEYSCRIRENDFSSKEEKENIQRKLLKIQNCWNNAVITDISGGGLRCNSLDYLEPGSQLHVKLSLTLKTEHKILNFTAGVISSHKMLNRPGFYEHRLEFEEIKKEEREIIIRFIFEEERKIRRREKGLV